MNNVTFMESYHIVDGKSYLRYNSLTESEKKVFNKEIIDKLYKTVKDKSLKINYYGIEKSKGDITKFSKYEDLNNAISILNRMYMADPQLAPIEIPKIVKTLEILKKYKSDFSSAFARKDDLMIITYNNIVAALIGCTSLLIATSIDYIKNPNGGYKTIFKDKRNSVKYQNVYINSLTSFNNMEIKGELKRLFNEKNRITESFNDTEILDESILTISIAVIGILFVLIYIIRDIVFIYYHARVSIAERLLNLAYFVEQHAYSQNYDNQKVFEKQLKCVEKIKKLADKINVDDKDANNQSKKNKKKDDEDNKSTSENNSTISDNDILL